MELTKAIQDKLAAEFPSREIKWLPRITKKGPKNNRVDIFNSQGKQVAGCMAHIDARQVMQRLDSVVGAGGWSDEYQPSAIGKGVECRLTVLGVSKVDVGVPSNTEPEKGAYSDALKRAAVKFGIGRHLYEIPTQWLEFDGWKITGHPSLPPRKPPVDTSREKASLAVVVDHEPEHSEDLSHQKPPAAPQKKLKPQSESVIADLRATIEGGTDGKATLGFVCNRATLTGLYKNTGERDMSQHAFKAALKWEGWPSDNGNFKKDSLNNGSVMPADKGLALFDWLVARKETE